MRALFTLPLVLLLVCLLGCESRFSKHQLDNPISTKKISEGETILSKKEIRNLALNDLIQYLKVLENQNWIHVSEAHVQDILKINNNAQVLEFIADYYLGQNDFKKAFEYNTEAESQGANSIDFYKKRAKILTAVGQYGLAVDYLNKAVMLNQNDPDMYLLKGDVYLKLGDSSSALRYKEQAFLNDSNRTDIGIDLAHIYASTRRYPEALKMADYMIENGVEVKSMTFLKAKQYRERQLDEEANAALSELLNSGFSQAGELLVSFFNNQKEYDSVIYYSTKVLEIDSSNLMSLHSKAMAFDQKGYFASSLVYYEQLLALDSLNEEALEGIRKVKGKIAYLRKLREQREAIPTFDFASPKNETN